MQKGVKKMLPRMRTIPQAVEELKKQDKDTAITVHYLRSLVKRGHIPSVNTGRKILINLDTIGEYIEKQPAKTRKKKTAKKAKEM